MIISDAPQVPLWFAIGQQFFGLLTAFGMVFPNRESILLFITFG